VKGLLLMMCLTLLTGCGFKVVKKEVLNGIIDKEAYELESMSCAQLKKYIGEAKTKLKGLLE